MAIRACSLLTRYESAEQEMKYINATNVYISTSLPSRSATLLAAPTKSVMEST